MSTSDVSAPVAKASAVEITGDALVVTLRDGRILSVPLAWFPPLEKSTGEQRAHWTLIGDGTGIHWPALDVDISVAGLLGLPD